MIWSLCALIVGFGQGFAAMFDPSKTLLAICTNEEANQSGCSDEKLMLSTWCPGVEQLRLKEIEEINDLRVL